MWEDLSTTSDGVTSTTCSTNSDHCMFKDKITNVVWSETVGTSLNFQNAITECDDLNLGSYSDWRLPTQKEWMIAYVHGITSVVSSSFIGNVDDNFWSNSTDSFDTSNGLYYVGSSGLIGAGAKTSNKDVVCVRN